MTYTEALAFINGRLQFGIHPGLRRIERLCALLGNPQDTLKIVHVAGTNGKGSVSTMLSSIFQESGYKTGLFTSPYITDFCERIQVDGQPVSQDALVKMVERIRPYVLQMEEEGQVVTEFEMITAVAFQYFADSQCDIVVLEVGLGGRLDSTNVIARPLVSVITSISLDHTAILGGTIAQIAAEKAGIIKENGVTVTTSGQPMEALEVIMQESAKKHNVLRTPNLGAIRPAETGLFGNAFEYGGQSFATGLPGAHQIQNAVLAIEAARAVHSGGFPVSETAVRDGIQKAALPARLEVLSRNPLVILDGAHNTGGMKALCEFLIQNKGHRKITAVMGMLSDKNYREIVAQIAPLCQSVIAVPIDNPRALSPEVLGGEAAKYCKDVSACHTYTEALDRAIGEVDPNKMTIICGSLYLAGAIRQQAASFARIR